MAHLCIIIYWIILNTLYILLDIKKIVICLYGQTKYNTLYHKNGLKTFYTLENTKLNANIDKKMKESNMIIPQEGFQGHSRE